MYAVIKTDSGRPVATIQLSASLDKEKNQFQGSGPVEYDGKLYSVRVEVRETNPNK